MSNCQCGLLCVDEQHDAENEKQRELYKYDHAAGEQSFFCVAFTASGQQTLHHGLICAVAGHGEECPTDQAGPEGIAAREAEGEIENAKLSAGGCSGLSHFMPTTWNFVKQEQQGSDDPVMYRAN